MIELLIIFGVLQVGMLLLMLPGLLLSAWVDRRYPQAYCAICNARRCSKGHML